MSFEVRIAGRLDHEPERILMGRLIGDLNKRYRASPEKVSLTVGPSLAGTCPDALLDLNGRAFVLELKPVDEAFAVNYTGEGSPGYTLTWDHPERVRIDRDFVHQVARYHEAMPQFFGELGTHEQDPGLGQAEKVPCWLILNAGNESRLSRKKPDLVPWFAVMDADSLIRTLESATSSPALSATTWAGIYRRLEAEASPTPGQWSKVLERRFPTPRRRSDEPEADELVLPENEVDIRATLDRIAKEGRKEYSSWVGNQLASGPEGARNLALRILVSWKSELSCQALVTALEQGTKEERTFAIGALQGIHCPLAVPVLDRDLTLDAENLEGILAAYVTCAQWDAFARLKSLVHELIAQGVGVEDHRWELIVRIFRRFGGDEPAQELVQLYKRMTDLPARDPADRGWYLGSVIVETLGQIKSQIADTFLAELLGETDVGADALKALASGSHPGAIPSLSALLKSTLAMAIETDLAGRGSSDDSQVGPADLGSPDPCRRKLEAIRHALVLADSPLATRVLLSTFEELLRSQPSDTVGEWFAQHIVYDILEENRKPLEHICLRSLNDVRTKNKQLALTTLGMVATRDSVETLWRLAGESWSSEWASYILGDIADARLREKGRALLSSENPLLRAAGILVCHRETNDWFDRALKSLEDDNSSVVRRAVFSVYGELKSPALQHRLVRHLFDKDLKAREAAWYGSHLEPLSDEDGCRLKVVGGGLVVGRLYRNDACLVVSKGRNDDPLWVIPFDQVRSHAMWNLGPGNQGVWIVTERDAMREDIVLLPQRGERYPWDRAIVAYQWYPPLRKALPGLEVQCDGEDWRRVRAEIPRDREVRTRFTGPTNG